MKTENQQVQGQIIEDEDGYLIYCENGEPVHAGVVRVNGKIYYAGHDGVVVCGHHKDVHRDMANRLLKRGVYIFGEDGVLVEGSYRKPERRKGGLLTSLAPKQKKLLMGCVILAILSAIAVYLFFFRRTKLPPAAPAPAPATTTAPAETHVPTIELPEDGQEVYLCSKDMQAVYSGSMTLKEAISRGGTPGQPYVFRYRMSSGARGVLHLDGKSYELDPEQTELEICNLKTDAEYVYSVTVSEGDASITKEGFFRTADINRFIYFTGVKNTRDIGGYRTLDGKRVRQGLLIRGSELDGLSKPDFYLADPAETADFGFRYDLDLRSPETYTGEYVSRLGEDVRHSFFDCPLYGQIFREDFFPALRQIFTDLADVNNYPIYFHCAYGADRSGTIIYLLQGLLGVPEEKMNFEYMLSGYVFKDCTDMSLMQGVRTTLASYPGDNVNEQIVSFLTQTVGVTAEQVERIRSILLEN